MDKQNRSNYPNMKTEGPLIESVYPNMLQLRDEIEDAIAYLKARKP